MATETPAEVLSALKRFLLPVSDGNLPDAAAKVRAFAVEEGVDAESVAVYLTNVIDAWVDSGAEGRVFRRVVGIVLSTEAELDAGFDRAYFRALETLTGERQLLSLASARGLLSDALLIKRLLVDERMSSAQIAQVLNASQNTAEYTWSHVQQVATALNERPALSENAVEVVTRADQERDESFFADADLDTAIEILSVRAERLGYRGDLRRQLRQFAPSYSGFAPAYSVILHVNALITEFFNHPLSQAAYEFNPRGGAIAELVNRVHKSYSASESPYLNNAKGAFAFDTNWAWGRKEGFRSRAHALVAILADLGAMPYVPRRELAALIRVFAHRLEALASVANKQLAVPAKKDVSDYLGRLAAENSATFGILEQRTIDVVAPILLPQGRWRGLGDSVNASNSARRKLGDIEVVRAETREINAIEVHGGALTDPYVLGHKRTFGRLLDLRREELALVADPEDWKITVTYVAHSLRGLAKHVVRIHDFVVTYEFVTYAKFFEHAKGPAYNNLFNELVPALNERRVPQVARDRFLKLVTD